MARHKNIWKDQTLDFLLYDLHCSLVVLNQFYLKWIYFYDQDELKKYYFRDSTKRKKQWEKISVFRIIQEEKVISELKNIKIRIKELKGKESEYENMEFYFIRKTYEVSCTEN